MPITIPLTVQEPAGIDRVGNPVNSGVPLPKGAVHDVAKLRVLDSDGRVVLASIEPRARWLGDRSLKWVTVHFLADVAANGTAAYTLVESEEAAPESPLRITETDAEVTVVTGPAKFLVPKDRLAPFAQVFVREDMSKPFGDADALLAESARVTLVARNGASRVVPRTGEHEGEFRTELVRIDETAFTQTARVETVEVEERGPARAVVALKGTFSTEEVQSLDFTARLYFYSGSPTAEMTFSVRNRQMDDMARFVGIERLAVALRLKGEGGGSAEVGVDGEKVERITSEGSLHLAQPSWRRVDLNGNVGGQKSDGWVRYTSNAGTLTAGTRWSWEVAPIGFQVERNGTVALDLKSPEGERIDLYTGGAKTRFCFFRFDRGDAPAAESIAAGTREPLFAACDPNWYCQETRVFGDLYADNPALFQPQYRDVIGRYQARIDTCIRRIVEQRPRPDWDVDEFGWLNFGSGLHHSTTVREDDHESWWDSNYYDFPHAVIVNFLRTGDRINLTTAFEAGLHLADLDICHSVAGQPELAGSPRSGPVVGHFRNYTRGQPFFAHTSFTFYKNESLYELYYLTGERWFHEIGLLSSEFAMQKWGKGALRNVAHGIWGVLSAYRDTHDERYLDRARFFVEEWAMPWQDEHEGSFDDQLWMYGLQLEAYDKYYRITGDHETARYNLRAIDALIAEEKGEGRWKPTRGLTGINLCGFGYAYDYTGDGAYLAQGLELLEKTTEAEGMRVKTFAQQFRASPYFLGVLVEGYEPERVLRTDSRKE